MSVFASFRPEEFVPSPEVPQDLFGPNGLASRLSSKGENSPDIKDNKQGCSGSQRFRRPVANGRSLVVNVAALARMVKFYTGNKQVKSQLQDLVKAAEEWKRSCSKLPATTVQQDAASTEVTLRRSLRVLFGPGKQVSNLLQALSDMNVLTWEQAAKRERRKELMTCRSILRQRVIQQRRMAAETQSNRSSSSPPVPAMPHSYQAPELLCHIVIPNFLIPPGFNNVQQRSV